MLLSIMIDALHSENKKTVTNQNGCKHMQLKVTHRRQCVCWILARKIAACRKKSGWCEKESAAHERAGLPKTSSGRQLCFAVATVRPNDVRKTSDFQSVEAPTKPSSLHRPSLVVQRTAVFIVSTYPASTTVLTVPNS